MNIVSALALLLEGHTIRRKSHIAAEGAPGDYRLDEQLSVLAADRVKGVICTTTHSVFGRKQNRSRYAYLHSDDILADDWEIVAPSQPHAASAQGIEARSDETHSGSAEGESPVGRESDAP